jgi:hypothetical protein
MGPFAVAVAIASPPMRRDANLQQNGAVRKGVRCLHPVPHPLPGARAFHGASGLLLLAPF